jgi:uncharacterized membrane protein YhaH (DUF805 family)
MERGKFNMQRSPIAWAIRPLKRYADFSGRSPRAEYWWFLLLEWLAMMVFIVLVVTAVGDSKETNPYFDAFIVPFVLAFIVLIVPNIAVQIRRLHDQDRSGWFILLFAIPYIGGLIGFIFMCIPGTPGPNRFGPDPYGRDNLQQVFA